ncbi:MAG: glycosyltransferase family 2 protein [Desulfovibrio sp.]|jgi:glycosyltransferase involved in cell wall biosynthesis
MDSKQLTIAVCTYRRFDWLEKCLRALEEQTLSAKLFRVLVIDNSLTPEESAHFKENLHTSYDCEYVITEKVGLSYARNLAVAMCDTPYIGFLDDDALADPCWAEEILDTFQAHHGAAGVVGGSVSPIWETDRPDWLQGDLLHALTVLDWGEEELAIREGKWLVGTNVAYSMRALSQTGGFDESLGRNGHILLCHEELALNLHIQQLGYSVVFRRKAHVQHLVQKERMTQKWLCEQAFWEAVSRAIFHNEVNIAERLHELEIFFTGKLKQAKKIFKHHKKYSDALQQTKQFNALGWEAAQKLGMSSPSGQAPQMARCVYIVTPSFNARETIDTTIMSVLNQRGDFYIRYHVQDGGSTDGTVETLEHWHKLIYGELENRLPNNGVIFTYSVEPDKGMYDAVNKGFAKTFRTVDEVMTWINADDSLFPNACADALRSFDITDKINWICGATNVHDSKGGTLTNHLTAYPQGVLREGLCDGKHWQMLQQEGTFWKSWMWDKVGGLRGDLQYCGDWDLWRRFAHIDHLYCLDWALGSFQVREGQLSAQGNAYQVELNKIVSMTKRANALESLVKEATKLTYPAIRAVYEEEGLLMDYRRLEEKTIPCMVKPRFSEYLQAKSKQESLDYLMAHGGLARVSQTASHDPEPPFTKYASEEGQPIPVQPQTSSDFRQQGRSTVTEYVEGKLDSSRLHDLYLRSPQLVRRLLTGVKYRFILPALSLPQYWRTWRTIKKSGLFFSSFYLKENPDVAETCIPPLKHFILFGAKELRRPNPLFDVKWYLQNNPDVLRSGINPLLHYIEHGQYENRSPSEEFNQVWYRAAYPDVAESGMEPLAHFLLHGIFEGRQCNP